MLAPQITVVAGTGIVSIDRQINPTVTGVSTSGGASVGVTTNVPDSTILTPQTTVGGQGTNTGTGTGTGAVGSATAHGAKSGSRKSGPSMGRCVWGVIGSALAVAAGVYIVQ